MLTKKPVVGEGEIAEPAVEKREVASSREAMNMVR